MKVGSAVRIDKYISETGFCSRRETKRLIAAGRIAVNGIVCEANILIEPEDIVWIDGEPITSSKGEPVYLALNKPIGITCTANFHMWLGTLLIL